MTPPLTQAQLRAEIDYDPRTGVVTRRVARCNKIKVGDVCGSPDTHGHLQIRVFGKLYLLHKLIWFWMTGEWPERLDHRDTDPANNRWKNLRKATRSQNNLNANCKRTSKTGVKNVMKVRGKYRVRVTIGGKRVHVGYFNSIAAGRKAHASHLDPEFGRM